MALWQTSLLWLKLHFIFCNPPGSRCADEGKWGYFTWIGPASFDNATGFGNSQCSHHRSFLHSRVCAACQVPEPMYRPRLAHSIERVPDQHGHYRTCARGTAWPLSRVDVWSFDCRCDFRVERSKGYSKACGQLICTTGSFTRTSGNGPGTTRASSRSSTRTRRDRASPQTRRSRCCWPTTTGWLTLLRAKVQAERSGGGRVHHSNGGGLFKATAAEYNNPFVYGNADHSLTPKQGGVAGRDCESEGRFDDSWCSRDGGACARDRRRRCGGGVICSGITRRCQYFRWLSEHDISQPWTDD